MRRGAHRVSRVCSLPCNLLTVKHFSESDASARLPIAMIEQLTSHPFRSTASNASSYCCSANEGKSVSYTITIHASQLFLQFLSGACSFSVSQPLLNPFTLTPQPLRLSIRGHFSGMQLLRSIIILHLLNSFHPLNTLPHFAQTFFSMNLL